MEVQPEQIDTIFTGSDEPTEHAVCALRDIYAFKHVTYHGARLGAKAVDQPFIRTTYDPSWVKKYLTMSFIDVDPVVREGFSRASPFRWDDIQLRTDAEREFFALASKHDVGLTGLTIPIRDKDNRRAILSIASDLVGPPWADFCRTNMINLVEIAHRIHQLAISEIGEEISHPPLAPRELETLYWTTKGKTAGDIAVILNLKPYTVAAYIRSARHKLNATTVAQAVSVAIQRGLISEAGQV